MVIFLAGGVSGNLKPAFKSMAESGDISRKGFIKALQNESFWRGGESRHWLQDVTSPIKENEGISLQRESDILLHSPVSDEQNWGGFDEVNSEAFWQGSPRGVIGGGYDPIIRKHKPYILESFYYVDEDTERLLPYFGDFLLDSGAFTFMQNSSIKADWNEYVERYADFINRNKIEKFFELDIDCVVGYEEVKKLRFELEKLTGRQVIPVWHKSRGYGEFEALCAEYPYVAIGGIVSKEITRDQYKAFPAMIQTAHKLGAKVHGLGFTNLALLPKIHFDSVDSTAWTTGNRFGFIYQFDGKTMIKRDAPKGCRIGKPREAALINYTEWIKFQKYAEAKL